MDIRGPDDKPYINNEKASSNAEKRTGTLSEASDKTTRHLVKVKKKVGFSLFRILSLFKQASHPFFNSDDIHLQKDEIKFDKRDLKCFNTRPKSRLFAFIKSLFSRKKPPPPPEDQAGSL